MLKHCWDELQILHQLMQVFTSDSLQRGQDVKKEKLFLMHIVNSLSYIWTCGKKKKSFLIHTILSTEEILVTGIFGFNGFWHTWSNKY